MDRQISQNSAEVQQITSELEFRNPIHIGRRVAVSLAVGLFFVILLVAHFLLLLLSTNNQSGSLSPAFSSVFGVGAFFAIAYAVYLLRCPRRVITNAEGIRVEWLIRQSHWRWQDIAEVRDNKVTVLGDFFSSKQKLSSERDVLELYSTNDKLLVKLISDLENFTELSKYIRAASSQAQGRSTYDSQEEARRKLARDKRSLRIAGGVGLFIIALSITMGIVFYEDQRVKKRLDLEGVRIQAKVLRHYIYNVTPRLEYEYTDEQGNRFKENVMMSRKSWNKLQDCPTVEIVYIPAEPKHSRLVEGQEEESVSTNPAVNLILVIGGMGLGLVFFGSWLLGITSIKTEGGKIRVIRIGQASAPPPIPTEVQRTGNNILPLPQASPIPNQAADENEISMIPPESESLPGGLRAIVILNGIFGGLGVVFNIGRVLLLLTWSNPTMPVGSAQVNIDTITEVIASGLRILLWGGLIISTFGLMKRRNWGRLMAMTASAGLILMTVIEIVLAVLLVGKIEEVDQQQCFALWVGVGVAVFLKLLVMVYPIIVCGVMGRRSAKNIFNTKSADPVQALNF